MWIQIREHDDEIKVLIRARTWERASEVMLWLYNGGLAAMLPNYTLRAARLARTSSRGKRVDLGLTLKRVKGSPVRRGAVKEALAGIEEWAQQPAGPPPTQLETSPNATI